MCIPQIATDNLTSVIISDSKQNLKDTTVTSMNATQTPSATTTTTVTTAIPPMLGGGGSSSGGGNGLGYSGGSSSGGGVGGGGLSVATATLTTSNHLDVPQAGNPNLLSPDVLNQRRGEWGVTVQCGLCEHIGKHFADS